MNPIEPAASLPGRPESLWMATTPSTEHPALAGEPEVDVAVLGAGIAGLTAAYLLQRAGARVAVVEARRVAAGVSGHTTAKLTALHGLLYQELVERHGKDAARVYADANQRAVRRVEELALELKVDCDLVRASAYTYAEREEDVGTIEREAEIARELGLPARLVTETDLPYPVRAAVELEDQAHFHPRRYLLALVGALEQAGGQVFERTTALEIGSGSPRVVTTDRGRIRARSVLVTTHQPFSTRGFYFARMRLKRSHVLGLLVDGPVPRGMYISADPDFRSLRPQEYRGETMLLVGGEPHRPGQEPDVSGRVRRLEAWARERFRVRSVEFRWATQDNVPHDLMPYVGRFTRFMPHVFVATGFGGWGMTNGTAAGELLCDLVLGRENPLARVLDPSRLAVAAALQGIADDSVHVTRDLLGAYEPEDAPRDPEALAPGEARVFRRGIEPVAAHRDDAGALHLVSAVCTHLHCIVAWNDAERTWDCPCHGSRFAPDGAVLQGPATEGLARAEPT